MSIPDNIKKKLADEEIAHAYVDEFLNLRIATQLKVLREQRDFTQQKLADLSGMKQERISVLENVNYSSWSINTLRKLAKALDVTLKVSFETFGSCIADMQTFSRQSLQRLARVDELTSGHSHGTNVTNSLISLLPDYDANIESISGECATVQTGSVVPNPLMPRPVADAMAMAIQQIKPH